MPPVVGVEVSSKMPEPFRLRKYTGMSMEVIVTSDRKLVYFTYFREVNNLFI